MAVPGSSKLGASDAQVGSFLLGDAGSIVLDILFTDTVHISDAFTKLASGYTTSMSHTVNVAQVISKSAIVHQSFSHTVHYSQDLSNIRTLVFALHDTVHMSEDHTYKFPYYAALRDNFFVSQNWGYHFPVYFNFSNTVNVVSSLIQRERVLNYAMASTVHIVSQFTRYQSFSLGHTVNISDSLIKANIALYAMSDTVNVDDGFEGGRQYPVLFASNPHIGEVWTFKYEYNHTLTDIQTLQEKYTVGGDFNRTLTDIGVNTDRYGPTLYIGNPNTHPYVTGVQIMTFGTVILEGTTGAIILPVPELSNTIASNSKVTVKQAMSGKTYSYAQTSHLTTLKYKWYIGMLKAHEFKDWLIKNHSEIVFLTLWNGEKWRLNITTDELPQNVLGPWRGAAREKIEVEIEFKGFKING